jgi:SAM-dependent methyltransferase
MTDLDAFVNKTVPFKFSGVELRFDLSHALFSSYDIDQGTRLLLKAIARDPVLARARRVLDTGCGTGVIGLSIAKAFPEAEVLMRDRDSLAVAFSERNRLANKLRGRTAWQDPQSGEARTELAAPRAELGLLAQGLEPPSGPRSEPAFDFVVSNLPAKAGGPVLEAFFAAAAGKGATAGFLAQGGRLAVVIVNTLAEKAAAWIAAAGLEVVATERGTGHRVFIVERAAGLDAAPEAVPGSPVADEAAPKRVAGPVLLDLARLDLSAYVRGESSFKYADVAYRAMGFWGLPDFDTVGYAPSLAAETAAKALPGSLVREALVVNPGVGHFPIWLARKLGPSRISAASRDLLSLAATGANLAMAGGRKAPEYRCIDYLRLDELGAGGGEGGTAASESYSFDLLAEFADAVPDYDWIGPAWERAARLVKAGGAYLVIAAPTELVRAEKRRPSGWRLAAERKRRGFAAMAFVRQG